MPSVSQSDIPITIPLIEKAELQIKQVSCGAHHSLFLTDLGKVYSCGQSEQGQLGMMYTNLQNVFEPTRIQSIEESTIVQVEAGMLHSLFLTNNGEVLACGNNKFF